jgi:hypothetical protein
MRPRAISAAFAKPEKIPCLAKRAARYHGRPDMAMAFADFFRDARILIFHQRSRNLLVSKVPGDGRMGA